MSSWKAIRGAGWPDTVELLQRLGEPWPEATAVQDLDWWADGRSREGYGKLARRWGWFTGSGKPATKRVRNLVETYDTENRQQPLLRPRAQKRPVSTRNHKSAGHNTEEGHNEGTARAQKHPVSPRNHESEGHNPGTAGARQRAPRARHLRAPSPSQGTSSLSPNPFPSREGADLLVAVTEVLAGFRSRGMEWPSTKHELAGRVQAHLKSCGVRGVRQRKILELLPSAFEQLAAHEIVGEDQTEDDTRGETVEPGRHREPDVDQAASLMWAPVSKELKEAIRRMDWEIWLEPLVPVGIADNGLLILTCQNPSYRDWIAENYGPQIEAASGEPGIRIITAREFETSGLSPPAIAP